MPEDEADKTRKTFKGDKNTEKTFLLCQEKVQIKCK